MATEKRLIFLEDAIARIVDTPSDVATMAFEGYYGFIQNPANILVARQHEIIDLLEAVTTVDAVEAVHGRWTEAEDGDGAVCSVCGEDFCNIYLEVERFLYCPNCGADMRERNDYETD